MKLNYYLIIVFFSILAHGSLLLTTNDTSIILSQPINDISDVYTIKRDNTATNISIHDFFCNSTIITKKINSQEVPLFDILNIFISGTWQYYNSKILSILWYFYFAYGEYYTLTNILTIFKNPHCETYELQLIKDIIILTIKIVAYYECVNVCLNNKKFNREIDIEKNDHNEDKKKITSWLSNIVFALSGIIITLVYIGWCSYTHTFAKLVYNCTFAL